MSDDRHREELCPAYLAFPGEHDVRVIVARADGTTLQTWHKEDCPIDRKAEGERR
ncbi:hypothetical protein AB0M94_37385 [Streptomyces xanthochromogenes]|uniref:hypothetical protein n=1 Tax=Streptomyces xanthochromogenes TaxID=67384 RepID=UPI0034402A50